MASKNHIICKNKNCQFCTYKVKSKTTEPKASVPKPSSKPLTPETKQEKELAPVAKQVEEMSISQPSSDTPQQARSAAPNVSSRARPRRLEDVFQDDIMERFQSMADFKRFARSNKGLCLKNNEIENILEDHRRADEQKYEMLARWQQKKGKAATAQKILEITDAYFRDEEEA